MQERSRVVVRWEMGDGRGKSYWEDLEMESGGLGSRRAHKASGRSNRFML
jgi:hypothetical protein